MAQRMKNLQSPKTVKQYNKLVSFGIRHQDKSNPGEALRYFTKALDFHDFHPNVLILMARCLFDLGMKNKAIALMEHALDQNAEDKSICSTLGNACISMGFNELAVKFYSVYCNLNPEDPLGYNNLATAMRENDQLDEAIQMLQDIIPIFPESAILWNTLAATISFREGYPAAIAFYEEAYRLDPTIPMFSSNLCLAYGLLRQSQKSYDFARKTIKLAPNSPASYKALTQSSFRIGDFEGGFEGLAWHNHVSDPGAVFFPYNITTWQGQDLRGKTILIGAEQGVADELLFSSLYPALIKEAKQVIIGCDKRLVPLFKNSFPEATILAYTAGQHDLGYLVRLYEGLEPENVDYMCIYTELLRYKWRSLKDIPDMSAGFLSPPQAQIDHWKAKLAGLPHKINVGICWRSGLKQAKRNMYYPNSLDWVPVLKSDKVNFINVQYGECADEIKELLDTHGIILHDFEDLNLKDDFEGTAALMANLDIVIGPAISPVTQAATAGCRSWWINYNNNPWWSFGEDITPIFKKNRMSVKPHTLDWQDYLRLFAEEEFTPWLTEKLKAVSSP